MNLCVILTLVFLTSFSIVSVNENNSQSVLLPKVLMFFERNVLLAARIHFPKSLRKIVSCTSRLQRDIYLLLDDFKAKQPLDICCSFRMYLHDVNEFSWNFNISSIISWLNSGSTTSTHMQWPIKLEINWLFQMPQISTYDALLRCIVCNFE